MLNTFVLKFQGDLGSFEVEGSTTPPISTPEPSSVVLLLTGMGATVLTIRRTRPQ